MWSWLRRGLLFTLVITMHLDAAYAAKTMAGVPIPPGGGRVAGAAETDGDTHGDEPFTPEYDERMPFAHDEPMPKNPGMRTPSAATADWLDGAGDREPSVVDGFFAATENIGIQTRAHQVGNPFGSSD